MILVLNNSELINRNSQSQIPNFWTQDCFVSVCVSIQSLDQSEKNRNWVFGVDILIDFEIICC